MNYRQWLKQNKVDSYAYAVWLGKTYPGRHWKDINTAENRAGYLKANPANQQPNQDQPAPY